MANPSQAKYPPVKTMSNRKRVALVKDIFSTITAKYDFLNHLLSLRRDIAWRRFAVSKMHFFQTGRFLDVACGTGDLSIETALHYPSIKITGIDFVAEMVNTGRKKIITKRLSGQITFLQADALRLPFPDNTFDVTGIAFGIRNIPDRTQALQEMLRVTVPGGQILILEMTFIQNKLLKYLYYLYLNYLLPLLAKIFSTNTAAYYYLADSIMDFPSPVEFVRIMNSAGVINVQKHSLTSGITYLYAGEKKQT